MSDSNIKLVLITSVRQYKEQVQQLLRNCQVLHYSYQDVVGHRDVSHVSDNENWFVGDRFETDSITFFAMVPETKVDCLFDQVQRFNNHVESLSRIHIATLHLEKTNDQ